MKRFLDLVRQRENYIWSSVSFAYIAVKIWRQFHSINDNLCKMTKFNYYFVFLNRQTFKKDAYCVNYKIKLKQSHFERNAKKILGFEHFVSRNVILGFF
jgi:hypothetical protein